MKRDHKKISPTAFNHIIWRTFYGVSLAAEFLAVAKKYCPLEYVFDKSSLKNKKITTPKTAAIFEGRYKAGAKALENYIKINTDCTIIELAAGFSLHGAYFTKKYPKITYIETDLLEIIKIKEKIINEIGAKKSNLYFEKANALDKKAISRIISSIAKPKSKIVFYCEGLLSYFSDNEKSKIAQFVKSILKKHGGAWITPDPALSAESRNVLEKYWPDYKKLVEKAEKMAKQRYCEHGFINEKKTDRFFSECGFKINKYSWPPNLKSFKSAGFNKQTKAKLKKILKKYGKVWELFLDKA